jgi:hypothetical protein
VGAIPEVLRPLSSSLALESAAPEHLAEGIHEALTGNRVLPTAELCETYAAENYAWPIVVSKVNCVYQDVLGTRCGNQAI